MGLVVGWVPLVIMDGSRGERPLVALVVLVLQSSLFVVCPVLLSLHHLCILLLRRFGEEGGGRLVQGLVRRVCRLRCVLGKADFYRKGMGVYLDSNRGIIEDLRPGRRLSLKLSRILLGQVLIQMVVLLGLCR